MESNGDPLARLPHGIPFRFVDRILELVPGERIVTLKNVTMNDHDMQGHFPGNPILPGVLLLEAMAQTSGLLLPEGSSALLAQVKDARFRRPVLPGDQVRIEAGRLAGLRALHRFEAKAFVDGARVAEAEIVLVVTDAKGKDGG
ncbi:MAG TPA: 3-hydroxyacyl-ACP dehydratase FabZ [Candidatus Acidoferrum sp.]|nr:3-hydroxyacyl-ACP dehydratase FabZ [Candidatus Acidoferrum sp.]